MRKIMRWVTKGKIMRFILCLVTAVGLSGCVGLITMHNPVTSYPVENVKLGARGWCCSGPKTTKIKSEVRTSWGEPDEMWREGTLEKWRYNQDALSWVAIMPVVIIPIPLGVPTGHNYTTFTFIGEQLISAEATDRKGLVALCGFLPNDVSATIHFGCFSD